MTLSLYLEVHEAREYREWVMHLYWTASSHLRSRELLITMDGIAVKVKVLGDWNKN